MIDVTTTDSGEGDIDRCPGRRADPEPAHGEAVRHRSTTLMDDDESP
jgi:hypothetical protein